MWAVHARYRGRDTRRAELVRRFAEAFSALEGAGQFDIIGVEEIRAPMESSATTCDVIMALLAAGDWAISLSVVPERMTLNSSQSEMANKAKKLAAQSLKPNARNGVVIVSISGTQSDSPLATNITAAFSLIAHVLTKRSIEGREATSLVRSGLSQNEAAQELGISKQAISQRLHAAGWHAEQAGWQLAVNLLEHAHHSGAGSEEG